MSSTVVERTAPHEGADTLDLSSLRFLVAEDHDFQRQAVTALLRGLGAAAVYGAADGACALRALADAAHPVDVLVLDLAMPGMDGVELIRELGAAKAPVAVILNSSFAPDFLDVIHSLAEESNVNVIGAEPKPLTEEKLRRLLAPFVAKRK